MFALNVNQQLEKPRQTQTEGKRRKAWDFELVVKYIIKQSQFNFEEIFSQLASTTYNFFEDKEQMEYFINIL